MLRNSVGNSEVTMNNMCRTCAQIITGEYFFLEGSSFASNTLQVKDVLRVCIPELDLETDLNSAICRNCMSSLHIAYYFKTETIKNEETLRSKQHIRIKNFDALSSKSVLNEDNFTSSNSCVDSKLNLCIETIELEIDDINELKTELVYEDIDHTDSIDLQKNVELFDTNSGKEDPNVNIECPPLVPISEEYHLVEAIPTDLFEGHNDSDTIATSNADVNSDSDVKYSDMENETVSQDKSEINPENVTAFIEHLRDDRNKRDVKRPYKCSECHFRSDAKASLVMHKRIHTGEKPFHCSKCNYRAKRKAHLDDHMKIHTGERPFHCISCEKSFITKELLKKHSRIHTGEKPYRCMQCNFRTRHKLSITNHVKKIHIGIEKCQPSICYICGKCLAGPASLSTHMRIHTGVKSHLCELCGRYFREKGMLKNHLRIHTGEKPFKCIECDYIATRKAHLQDHMKTHVGHPDLVQCPTCEKRYPTKLLLKKHIKEEHNCKTEIVDIVEEPPFIAGM